MGFFVHDRTKGSTGASRPQAISSPSAPWGLRELKFNPRECARCGDMVKLFERHHIVYVRCMPKAILCIPCHGEITLMNTMFHRLKKRKLQTQERWYLWIAFLSIEKNQFYSAPPPEQQRWIGWLADHFRSLSMQMSSSAPRGQFTDDARPAGSVAQTNDPQPSDGEQAALLGAGNLR